MARAKNYIGAAGELRTASELSLRGYVTHIPAVDEGGDLFAVIDDTGAHHRVQVKTSASPSMQKWGNHTAHQVSIKAGLLQAGVQLMFVFNCIHAGSWHSLVTTQANFLTVMPGAVPAAGKSKNVWIVFDQQNRVTLGSPNGADVTNMLDAWDAHFPVIPTTGTVI